MEFSNVDIKLLPALFGAWQPKNNRSRQIAVLMSGGVDSSITAYLLKKQGWDVLGITMQIPVQKCTGSGQGCCGADVAFVCNELGIAHRFVDVKEAFEKIIIQPFRDFYLKGLTPNPCADCNSFLKFSLLWDFITEKFGIDYLATGHYAKVAEIDGQYRLGRAKDKAKDQSYFLYGIGAERLSKFILPLGELTKNQVRSMAQELGLSVADRSESMELCFAGEGDYRDILGDDYADKSGDMTDMQGNVIGTHKGVANYTIGQRRGLGFAGGEPLYVGRIDPEHNTIALGKREEVCGNIVKAEDINIFIPAKFVVGEKVFGKVRSYNNLYNCEIIKAGKNDMTVKFDEPIFAPSPGQKLVLYDDEDYIVAGGTIAAADD